MVFQLSVLKTKLLLCVEETKTVDPWLENGLVVVDLGDLAVIGLGVSKEIDLHEGEHLGGAEYVTLVEGDRESRLKENVVEGLRKLLLFGPLAKSDVVVLLVYGVEVVEHHVFERCEVDHIAKLKIRASCNYA